MTKKMTKLQEIFEAAKERPCPVDRSKYVIKRFLAGPMCGKCFPCSFGSYESMLRLKELSAAAGSDDDLAALRLIGQKMVSMSMCKKGKDVGAFLVEMLGETAFREHVDGVCEEMQCESFYEYRNVPDNCIRCGKCQDTCRYGAILGEKQVSIKCCHLAFEIRQKRCTKCGECIKVCPTKAIVKVKIETSAEVPV